MHEQLEGAAAQLYVYKNLSAISFNTFIESRNYVYHVPLFEIYKFNKFALVLLFSSTQLYILMRW